MKEESPEDNHPLHVSLGAVVVDCALCVVAALERADADRLDKATAYADSLQVLKLRESMAGRGFIWVPGHMEKQQPWMTTHPRHRINLALFFGLVLVGFCVGQLAWLYTGL
jgi:hypothetical protein